MAHVYQLYLLVCSWAKANLLDDVHSQAITAAPNYTSNHRLDTSRAITAAPTSRGASGKSCVASEERLDRKQGFLAP